MFKQCPTKKIDHTIWIQSQFHEIIDERTISSEIVNVQTILIKGSQTLPMSKLL